ncbi:MAG: hypothetical protein PF483_06560 [Halothiobacillus sp.]|jgi:hypothetical protein|uniref:hypothetical protein n=1 Tax=Halothiobacillus sp. TaxID=1891311 RepID=UPI002AD466C3|nr:hypothetical protein [Halothiobacillus sp.]MDA3876732.1 hypothetical protein [Halothiobacillus sp.]
MSSRTQQRKRRYTLSVVVTLLLAVPASSAVLAAGVEHQVKAQPGDIVILRNVPARPAARQMPPSNALMMNPSPGPEIAQGLGSAELTNAAYAALSANAPGLVTGPHQGPLTAQLVRENVQASTSGLLTPTQGGASLGSAGSAIRSATGGIAPSISGALVGSGLLPSSGGRP